MNVVLDFCLQTGLISPSNEEYDLLLERLKSRMEENHEETIYVIGIGGKVVILILIFCLLSFDSLT